MKANMISSKLPDKQFLTSTVLKHSYLRQETIVDQQSKQARLEANLNFGET